MNLEGTLINIAEEHTKLYELKQDQANLEVLIASTAQTREIFNTPELCGVPFQHALSEALEKLVRGLSLLEQKPVSRYLKEFPLDIIYILRGGLNFDLHNAVFQATGTYPEVTFVSSQRVFSKDTFYISEFEYKKWNIQQDAVICLGDISATGTTITHVLDQAIHQYHAENKKPRWLLFITIGTTEVISTLQRYVQKLAHEWAPNFEGITVVFLEQIFRLYTGHAQLIDNHLPFTDFFRARFPFALEFEKASLAKPVSFLERCAIYDGGSRSYEPHAYLVNLQKYWQALLDNKDKCDSMQLMQMKSDLGDYSLDFADWLEKRRWLNALHPSDVTQLYEAGKATLNIFSNMDLREVCQDRVSTITHKIELLRQNAKSDIH